MAQISVANLLSYCFGNVAACMFNSTQSAVLIFEHKCIEESEKCSVPNSNQTYKRIFCLSQLQVEARLSFLNAAIHHCRVNRMTILNKRQNCQLNVNKNII